MRLTFSVYFCGLDFHVLVQAAVVSVFIAMMHVALVAATLLFLAFLANPQFTSVPAFLLACWALVSWLHCSLLRYVATSRHISSHLPRAISVFRVLLSPLLTVTCWCEMHPVRYLVTASKLTEIKDQLALRVNLVHNAITKLWMIYLGHK